MDGKNELEMKRIVAQANEWCRESMTKKALADSALVALDEYVNLLSRYDPSWSERVLSVQNSFDLALCR